MTPHHWHATAAAWALHQARGTLTTRAEAERRVIVAELLEPPSVLRSPVWGRRGALGGHSDPTTTALIDAERPARRNRYAELAADITTRLALPAGHLPGDGDPLDRITTAIPAMLPGTAAATTTLLVRLDDRIRRELRMGPARRLLTGRECPACRHRLVYEQTLGPTDAWTVVCGADCRCTGVGCRCGQPGAVEGVPHIWPRAAVIGAVAGATPSPTT
ncbi:hypothetical protein EYA84_02150 [Verrucosispora sp. SN26_14.1]|uniref:hypothetical protein n=1 Tax=Verrucosispora sp. SN26_14.1 TaxID=2527879 RepID=UPI0010343378|nr:hypothetical protein [Verrucosispora sp. SN26_14.1]TBL44266.1 hypothetical protein EYA84_02150 [Verrucosispora sp. SN26_14.1]